MSRKSDRVRIRYIGLVLAALAFAPSLASAAVAKSAGEVTGNEYENAVLGAAHAEGDIWGGEQGTDPQISPAGPSRDDSLPLINTTPPGQDAPGSRSGRTGYVAELALFFDWLWASLRFANPS